MPVEIVTLAPDAWPAYKALRLESFQNDPQAYGTSYASAAAQPDAFFRGRLEKAAVELPGAAVELPGAAVDLPAQGQDTWLLFAREDGRLLGMTGAYRGEELPSGAARVVSVYVTPSARGRGISRLLMAAVLEKLAQAGIRRVVLGVTAGQEAAIGLYQSFGFRIVAIHSKVMGDGQVHEGYEMENDLSG